MARILVGTSGWHYESWKGPFFPLGLQLKDRLRFCVHEQFAVVPVSAKPDELAEAQAEVDRIATAVTRSKL
jgi:hypothetical protein